MTQSSAPDQTKPAPQRSRWLALLVLVVGIGIGAAITAVVVTRGDDSAQDSSTAPLSQVQASCSDWMSSDPGNEPDEAWCTDMFAWMSDQSGNSMMGSTMWQSPERMRTSCQTWVDQDRGDAGGPDQQRCDDMVDWMDQHMSGRGGDWMMDDSSN